MDPAFLLMSLIRPIAAYVLGETLLGLLRLILVDTNASILLLRNHQ